MTLGQSLKKVLTSNHNLIEKNIIRGIKLLLLGCSLSFIRSDILLFISGDTSSLNIFTNKSLITLWEIDILQFAGLAYILMALIKHYIKKPIYWLLIAIIIVPISPLLWGVNSDNIILSHMANSLFGASDLVYFPIFPWLYYPLIGMILGLMIRQSADTNKLLKSLLKPGIITLASGSLICLSNLDFHIGDYFRSGPGSIIWITGFLLVWIAINNMLIETVKENRLIRTIYRWGKDTTPIYLLHWIMISWATLLLGYESYSYTGTIILMIVFVLATNYLSKLIRIKI